MERSRISKAPVLEDFTHKFHDCSIRTKLDLRQGYNQLMLHPESRLVTTFSTPCGNFRPKRLVFGAKASQDLFDDAMSQIFGHINQCLNQRDNIMIGAGNWKEHWVQYSKELKIMESLLTSPSAISVRPITFYGY